VFSSDQQLGVDIEKCGDRFRRPAEMQGWFGNGSVVAVFSSDKQLGVDIEKCSDRFRRPLRKWWILNVLYN